MARSISSPGNQITALRRWWQRWFIERAGTEALPEALARSIRRQFDIRPEELYRLRCIGYADTYRDRPVTKYRVFDPETARRNGIKIQHNADLELHPELVLFLGHIDKYGKTYITDRRTRTANKK